MLNMCSSISGTLFSVLTLGAYKPHSVFSGDPFIKVSPRNIGVAYETFDCFFPSQSGIHVINGWYIPPQTSVTSDDRPKTILVCSDIHGNMSHNMDLLKFLTLTLPDHAIVIFDYVGFGLSSCDTSSPAMCLKSAVRALEYTLERTTAERLTIWGYRHGATIAAYLVTRLMNPINQLVLDTPLMRFSDDIREHLASHVHDPVAFIQGTFRMSDSTMDLERYLERFITEHDTEYLLENNNDLTAVKCISLVPVENKTQHKALMKYAHIVKVVPLSSSERTSLFIDQHRIVEHLYQNGPQEQKLITL